MIFLTNDDLKVFIKDNVLNDILENNLNILNTTELMSIEMIKSYIGHYYDTDSEFKKSGIDRNLYLMSLLTDLMLFNLSSRLTPTQIPEIRQQRYNDTISTLEKINTGKIVMNLMKRDVRLEPDSEFRFGSEKRITSQF